MPHSRFSNVMKFIPVALAAILLLTPIANAQWTGKQYSFVGSERGVNPQAGVIFDGAGNIYGTALQGGDASGRCEKRGGCGVVYALGPDADGRLREKVLHTFRGNDGASPEAEVIFDGAGNLYGTTSQGGVGNCSYRKTRTGCGIVFELTPNVNGEWTETVLYTFSGGNDGKFPHGGLIFDKLGNLYGTTIAGGSSGAGVVFELSPLANGQWSESVLYAFTGLADGAAPYAGLIFDELGNLYGTTLGGGSSQCNAGGCGIVFELTPSASGQWTETLLHIFTGRNDGVLPAAGLIFDNIGNLYGTAQIGGAGGNGIVFELTPGAGGHWSETIAHAFIGSDGASPEAGVTFDSAGNLYGTTQGGGPDDNGVVFELTPGGNGEWNESVVYSPTGDYGGRYPEAGVIFDSAGRIYGTTEAGGFESDGVVFKLSPPAKSKLAETIPFRSFDLR